MFYYFSLYSVILFFLSLNFISCTHFDRHPSSGYYQISNYSVIPAVIEERQDYNKSLIAMELGINSIHNLTPQQEKRIEIRTQLKKLEDQIEGSSARNTYFDLKPLLENDRECIQYLLINDPNEQEKWVKARGIPERASIFSKEIEEVISENDIALGMNHNEVQNSWGEPDTIEVAGNALFKNEKWLYKKYISTEEGYELENRLLYFESGRLVGWEKN